MIVSITEVLSGYSGHKAYELCPRIYIYSRRRNADNCSTLTSTTRRMPSSFKSPRQKQLVQLTGES